MPSTQITAAREEDLRGIEELLKSADLPWQDVADHLSDFLVARLGDEIVGVVGLEVRGTGGLLRSLAVRQNMRGSGLGRELYQSILSHARARGVDELGLLTTTAEGFFAKAGFERQTRDRVPDFVKASREFQELCPSSAVYMRMVIR